MNDIKYCYILLAFLTAACTSGINKDSASKYSQIVTKYTEIEQVISREVEDTFYVYIRLPKNYNTTNKVYPVLYLLDGDISFNMAISVVRYLQYGKDVPDLIIVAPSYGTMMSDKETNYRERDYTISEIDRFQGSGEAGNYLDFFKNELIPLIDANYRTNEIRILNGFSLGGLFTLHLLVNEPQLFDNYISGSPYLIDDINSLEEGIKNLPSFNNEKRLFLSVGKLEDDANYYTPIKKFSDAIVNKNNLKIEFKQFENGTHFTTPSEAMAYGLKFVFNENYD